MLSFSGSLCAQPVLAGVNATAGPWETARGLPTELQEARLRDWQANGARELCLSDFLWAESTSLVLHGFPGVQLLHEHSLTPWAPGFSPHTEVLTACLCEHHDKKEFSFEPVILPSTALFSNVRCVLVQSHYCQGKLPWKQKLSFIFYFPYRTMHTSYRIYRVFNRVTRLKRHQHSEKNTA